MSAADKIAEARALIEPLTEYAPGPWKVDSDGDVYADNSFSIAQIWDIVEDFSEHAETKLILSAPALRDTVAALADLADALAQENAKLQAENERLRKTLKPEWFYPADGYESEACRWSVGEVLNEDYFSDLSKTGQHVVEINVATPLPSIWAAVRFTCECADPDKCECDNDMIVTEHASEAEARAALGDAQ